MLTIRKSKNSFYFQGTLTALSFRITRGTSDTLTNGNMICGIAQRIDPADFV